MVSLRIWAVTMLQHKQVTFFFFLFLSRSYHKAAKLISALHLDTPMHALNRTVYWLEYLLRHDGAPYLRPAVYDLSFYEYYCLDVLALFLLCLVGAAFALYKVIVWYMGKGIRPMHLNGHCPNGHLVEEKKLK